MLISPAYAQAVGGDAGSALVTFLPLILIFAVFYFLLIRPQQKRMKQHKEMLAAMRRGDRIVTNGGLIGTITKVVDDNELQVEIAEGVRVRVARGMIAEVRAKGEPVPANEDEKEAAKEKGGAKG